MMLLFLCGNIWFAPVFAVLQYSLPLFQVTVLRELLRVSGGKLTLRRPGQVSKLPVHGVCWDTPGRWRAPWLS